MNTSLISHQEDDNQENLHSLYTAIEENERKRNSQLEEMLADLNQRSQQTAKDLRTIRKLLFG